MASCHQCLPAPTEGAQSFCYLILQDSSRTNLASKIDNVSASVGQGVPVVSAVAKDVLATEPGMGAYGEVVWDNATAQCHRDRGTPVRLSGNDARLTVATTYANSCGWQNSPSDVNGDVAGGMPRCLTVNAICLAMGRPPHRSWRHAHDYAMPVYYTQNSNCT